MFSGCTSKLNGPKQPDTNTAVKPAPLPATPPEPAYDSTAFAPLHPRALASRVTVLMFHDVVIERRKGGV
ncbi:MAG: hypothetical protein RJB05_1176, partial [Armatimonadota bacterium]